jgi:hypothetical protein
LPTSSETFIAYHFLKEDTFRYSRFRCAKTPVRKKKTPTVKKPGEQKGGFVAIPLKEEEKVEERHGWNRFF